MCCNYFQFNKSYLGTISHAIRSLKNVVKKPLRFSRNVTFSSRCIPYLSDKVGNPFRENRCYMPTVIKKPTHFVKV